MCSSLFIRLKQSQSTDPAAIEKMQKANKIVLTPSKSLPRNSSASYDDRIILKIAKELQAAVISNDNYSDLLREDPGSLSFSWNHLFWYTF